ncbi:MAG: 7-cyano-7-deazaguanine synthase QueC [Candidatus Melainabacteria bacterium GWF2_37_15]|nr:MAG: 7-cyano-7-deazaguanine synthase QueC [Candidatus Melainabacteria bacterium GWF2_37_15]
MKNTQTKSIILLSGGLDSLVSLGVTKEKYNVSLALTFDYGQRTAQQEIIAAQKITEHYSIQHRVIKLPWLEEITTTSLVNKAEKLPELDSSELDNPDYTEKSAKNVWVPNRNGVFINIAAGFADSMGFKYIIFGANKEEAATFPDNSETFIHKINESLQYSTLVKAEVVAPLAAYNKKEIVKIALENNVPLNLLRSCYADGEKHCGKCESCLRLKRALNEVIKGANPVEFAA